jgi:hypothetical protein
MYHPGPQPQPQQHQRVDGRFYPSSPTAPRDQYKHLGPSSGHPRSVDGVDAHRLKRSGKVEAAASPANGEALTVSKLSALTLDGASDDDAGTESDNSSASTNSSLLRRHFPQRFFILKSLTQVRLPPRILF